MIKINDGTRYHVTLEELEDQKLRGWPDTHPEDFCHRCGNRNLSWFVDSELWNVAWAEAAFEGGYQSVLCPPCFAELWTRATGHAMTWQLSPDVLVLLARLRPPADRARS